MDDLSKYIENRKTRDPAFAEGYEAGYKEFLVGALLKEARVDAGVTQEELANAIHTKKSVISRLENQASDARVSTLRKVAQALGKELVIELRDTESVVAENPAGYNKKSNHSGSGKGDLSTDRKAKLKKKILKKTGHR